MGFHSYQAVFHQVQPADAVAHRGGRGLDRATFRALALPLFAASALAQLPAIELDPQVTTQRHGGRIQSFRPISSFNVAGSAPRLVGGENDLAQDPFNLKAEHGPSLDENAPVAVGHRVVQGGAVLVPVLAPGGREGEREPARRYTLLETCGGLTPKLTCGRHAGGTSRS